MKGAILILGSLCAITYSCKKTSLVDDSLAAKGHIFIVDENNHIGRDYAGVKISIENSNVTTIPVNEDGDFNFPKMPDDQASLILNFVKPGYGTVKQFYSKALLDSFHNRQQTPPSIQLIPQSSVSVNSLSGVLKDNQFKMVCNVSVKDSRTTNGVTIFLLKNNSQVLYSNWTGDISNSRFWTIPVNPGDNLSSFCFTSSIDFDCNCDFLHSGDTVYLKAYGDTYTPFGNNYYDIQTGQLQFPGLNAKTSSETISFVVP